MGKDTREERQREFTLYLILFILLVIVGAVGYQKPAPVTYPPSYGHYPFNGYQPYPGSYGPYGSYYSWSGYPPWGGFQGAAYGSPIGYPPTSAPPFGWF